MPSKKRPNPIAATNRAWRERVAKTNEQFRKAQRKGKKDAQ